MDVRAQRISLWITPLFGAILLLAFVSFPGFLPTMSPQMPAEEVAAFYTQNSATIRFSMITFNLCAIMLVPFFMTIVVQIKRMAQAGQIREPGEASLLKQLAAVPQALGQGARLGERAAGDE
jgi:hypothetical protein